MRGRTPKPTHIRLVQGNPGKRPINDAELEVVAERPQPTLDLDDEEKVEFDKVCKLLEDNGLIATVDAYSLTTFAKAVVEFNTADKLIKELGEYYETNGPAGTIIKPHPAMLVRDRAGTKMFRFYVEFGMTPAQRSRLKVEKKKPKDKADRFFKEQA